MPKIAGRAVSTSSTQSTPSTTNLVDTVDLVDNMDTEHKVPTIALVHPPTAPIIALIVRRFVVPVLVEVHVAVVLAHVHLKLLRSAATLPAIVSVAYTVNSFRNAKRGPATCKESKPEIS